MRNFSDGELRLSGPYTHSATTNNFSLLNYPGTYTRHSPDPRKRHGVIDLAFANARALPLFSRWQPLPEATGSDHRAIAITFALPNTDFTPIIGPNWKLTDWPSLQPALQDFTVPSPNPSASLDAWFEQSLQELTDTLKKHTPSKTITKWSKPWWNPNITQLRTIYHSVHRDFRRGLSPLSKSKRRRMPTSMQSKTQNALTGTPSCPMQPPAMSGNLKGWQQEQKTGIFPAQTRHWLPPPLNFAHVPDITPEEVRTTLLPSSNLSAPGPDTIPYSVWKGVHKANPHIIPALLNPLLKSGYHPLSLKRANGVILAKPNKADYTLPTSYRIIVLLQTFSKILEKIVTLRLASIAKAVGLIHPHQCGSVAGLSTADAVTTLLHETKAMQHAKLKVSTLFLDIKGDFDNVVKHTLASTLAAKATPPYIINWVLSFLSDRHITLLFKGSPRIPTPVQVGVPQGSPISPLLFVIYMNILHLHDPSSGLTLSYVDDFAVTVGSPSYQQNIHILEEHFKAITAITAAQNTTFSIPKTELMHWRTPKDKAPTCTLPITLDNQIFHPGHQVRWVGFWLSPNFNPNTHFIRRLASAQASFGILQRFSSPGKGLSSSNCRKIALLAIRPMLTYGASVLTPTSSIKAMNKFWNSVLRWATGCFRATNQRVLWAEAHCPPLINYIHYLKTKFAIRVLLAHPLNNPVTGRCHPSFPTLTPDRVPSHTSLLRGRPNPPKKWNSTATKGVAYLPIEHLCSLLRYPIAGGTDHKLLPKQAKDQMLNNWAQDFPTPPYYSFPLTTSPEPFMDLHKFTATRIHQMRAQKSYLRGHKSWLNLHLSEKCDRCGEAPETTEHAILLCRAKATQRAQLLPGIKTLEEIWSDRTNTLALGAFITATKTNFPRKEHISPLLSGSETSSALSSPPSTA
ncbi:uncharacterized protein LAJ45_09214 [Morchella importuna]|uniref:uncharacterized protein n=1 Tax=Morchella importuna TaxID=1174673 RepID=UPI001E8D01C0|nr:uncharacterized protein LAJ45_09214 [Morchella importuna]KAH8146840.1 hypothetical protein LAJ45_09214 [Morchella importuna]